MNKSDAIKSTASRILGAMEAFNPIAVPPPHVKDAIGVYDAGQGTEPLWITENELIRCINNVRIRYDSISSVRSPTTKNRDEPDSAKITILMRDGSTEIIEVPGGRGKFCDAFEFSRFLMRAASLTEHYR